MDFKKLFETQQALDEKIYEKHPELKGQNNLDWKVLALQVELGECANEWRGFKKWSNDQEPRVLSTSCRNNEAEEFYCGICHETYKKDDPLLKFDEEGDAQCPNNSHERNWLMAMKTEYPLLEEYADCLSFILTIGLELNIKIDKTQLRGTTHKPITRHFTDLMLGAGTLLFPESEKTQNYHSIVGEFLMLGIELGFDFEQIQAAYYTKNEINHERQASGY